MVRNLRRRRGKATKCVHFSVKSAQNKNARIDVNLVVKCTAFNSQMQSNANAYTIGRQECTRMLGNTEMPNAISIWMVRAAAQVQKRPYTGGHRIIRREPPLERSHFEILKVTSL